MLKIKELWYIYWLRRWNKMIKVRDNITLEILKKFGFEENNGIGAYIRRINGEIAYMVYVTKRHRYLQIRCNKKCLKSVK